MLFQWLYHDHCVVPRDAYAISELILCNACDVTQNELDPCLTANSELIIRSNLHCQKYTLFA